MNGRLLTALVLVADLAHGISNWAFGDDTSPKLDRYGDPLPAGAVLRLGTTRLQAQGGSAWMPDGKTLVAKSGKAGRLRTSGM
jgi:hypothetical protein